MRGRYTGASTQKVTTQTKKQKYPYIRCHLKQLYWVPYYLRAVERVTLLSFLFDMHPY